jgi:hypothetical protein
VIRQAVARGMVGLALAAALSGCASPPAQFYTLAATAQPEQGALPAAYRHLRRRRDLQDLPRAGIQGLVGFPSPASDAGGQRRERAR